MTTSDVFQGRTHLCQCWAVTRRDGAVYGFTDHDSDLHFDGIAFRASSGLSSFALQQNTGLSVDNSEAVGVLSSDAIDEADIIVGRFDGADIRAWTVCWDDLDLRQLEFRGTIGTITRKGPSFSAELRGLTEALNLPRGQVFHRNCPYVLGAAKCGVDLAPLSHETQITQIREDGALVVDLPMRPPHWFTRGSIEAISGPAQGSRAMIKTDELDASQRIIQLWTPFSAPLQIGDHVRIIAGCDKRVETCKAKFDNIAAFGGFPHIPGEDWLMSVPRRDGQNDGGSLS